MAQSITIWGSTTAAGAVTPTSTGVMVLNPTAKATTFILSAVAPSTTAGTVYVEYSLDDPSQYPAPTMTWALLSSATALLSSVVAAAPYSWTVLAPIGAARINSTGGSTAGVSVYTLKALQSVTA